MSTDRAREVWEVERDRFGVMFSGPLEVGECIRVVSLDAVVSWLRHVDRLSEIPGASSSMPTFNPLWDAANALEAEFGVPQPEQPT